MATLLRACILGASGAVKATFSDGSLLLLTPAGTACLHVDGGAGRRAVQCTTQFALHSIQPKLAAVVELRNQHCSAVALCKPYLAVPRPGFESGVPVQAVRWPASTAAAAEQQLLTVALDGAVTLTSECRCAKLLLHPTGFRLAVTWPLHLPGGGRSCWVTQSFSSGDCPPPWAAPLRLTLAAQQQQQQQQQRPGEQPELGGSPEDSTVLGPSQRISQLPPPAHHVGVECCAFASDSWWLDSGTDLFPPDAPVLLEWTPEAVYQFLPDSGLVEVLIQADESLLRLDCRGYAQHYQPGSWASPKTYAAQAVPAFAWGPAGVRYPLGMITAHAQALREVSAKLYALGRAPHVSPLSGAPIRLPPAHAEASPSQPYHNPTAGSAAQHLSVPALAGGAGAACYDNTVVERQEVPGHATFTAFVDGRVHVAFQDRTMLKLAPGRDRFEALLPSGQLVCAPTAQPAELAPYLGAALEFAHWASITPLERALPSVREQQVQAQLGSTRRQSALCDLALGAGGSCDFGVPAATNSCPPAGGWNMATAPAILWQHQNADAAEGAAPAERPVEVAIGEASGGEDYMLQLITNGTLHPKDGIEREAFVEAWLRRNALLLDQL